MKKSKRRTFSYLHRESPFKKQGVKYDSLQPRGCRQGVKTFFQHPVSEEQPLSVFFAPSSPYSRQPHPVQPGKPRRIRFGRMSYEGSIGLGHSRWEVCPTVPRSPCKFWPYCDYRRALPRKRPKGGWYRRHGPHWDWRSIEPWKPCCRCQPKRRFQTGKYSRRWSFPGRRNDKNRREQDSRFYQ
jgi:hypothetical protein